MAYWDSKNGKIVFSGDYTDPNYPGWMQSDCGCCGGIQWGGESPEECNDCKGSGYIWKHAASGVLAGWPGGPFLGRETPMEKGGDA